MKKSILLIVCILTLSNSTNAMENNQSSFVTVFKPNLQGSCFFSEEDLRITGQHLAERCLKENEAPQKQMEGLERKFNLCERECEMIHDGYTAHIQKRMEELNTMGNHVFEFSQESNIAPHTVLHSCKLDSEGYSPIEVGIISNRIKILSGVQNVITRLEKGTESIEDIEKKLSAYFSPQEMVLIDLELQCIYK